MLGVLITVISWPFRLLGNFGPWILTGLADTSKKGSIGPKTGRWIENPNYGKSREWIFARYKRGWIIFLIIIFLIFLFGG